MAGEDARAASNDQWTAWVILLVNEAILDRKKQKKNQGWITRRRDKWLRNTFSSSVYQVDHEWKWTKVPKSVIKSGHDQQQNINIQNVWITPSIIVNVWWLLRCLHEVCTYLPLLYVARQCNSTIKCHWGSYLKLWVRLADCFPLS